MANLRAKPNATETPNMGRYCGMCDAWFKRLPTTECPKCGADTDKCPTDPNKP
jgi:rRNA maturation endonuclease Nob1